MSTDKVQTRTRQLKSLRRGQWSIETAAGASVAKIIILAEENDKIKETENVGYAN